jgi:hypothetical protein
MFQVTNSQNTRTKMLSVRSIIVIATADNLGCGYLPYTIITTDLS